MQNSIAINSNSSSQQDNDMEDINGKVPLFKKIDQSAFDRLDKFKQTQNYTNIQDLYNGLEEEQQKVLKGGIIAGLLIIPLLFLAFIWWQNTNLKEDLDLRKQIISQANEILGQKQGLQDVKFGIISGSPIDSDSMMVSRLSGLLGGAAIDMSKIQVKDFEANPVSNEVMKTEANFTFNNFSTDELMNLLSAMIQREKFRISEISITRNPQTNFLQGKFHAIHFSNVVPGGEEE